MKPTYSICMTHYNNASTLKRSLKSILSQTGPDFEIVVVDNKSNDGSENILRDYSDRGVLKLISARCSRGQGRQIAFENSSGDYVIANLDFDDVFKPRLKELLGNYLEKSEGNLLWAHSIDHRGFWGGESFTIAPRHLLSRLGGWRDLQFGEDWELARRAARAGMYRWTYFQLLEQTNAHVERKTFIGRLRFRYVRYRDLLRCGRRVFKDGYHVSVSQRVAYLLSRFALPLYESYCEENMSTFDPSSTDCYVDFGECPSCKQSSDR